MARFAILVFVVGTLVGCSSDASIPGKADPPLAGRSNETEKAVQIRIQPVDAADLERIRRYTDQFYSGQLEALHAKFSDELKQSLSLDRLRQMHAHVLDQYGKQTSIVSEDAKVRDPYRGFVRWAKFDKYDGVIEVQWLLRDEDTVAGFFIRPAESQGTGSTP